MQVGYNLKFLVCTNNLPKHQKVWAVYSEGQYSPADVQMSWYRPPNFEMMKRESHKSLGSSKGFYWHDRLDTRYLHDISKAREIKVQNIPLLHSLS